MAPFMDMLEETLGGAERALLSNIYSHYPFGDGAPGRDLEVVREHLQKYLTFFKLIRSDPNFVQMSLMNPESPYDQSLLIEDVVTRIDNNIRDLIFDRYGTQPEASEVAALCGPLLAMVRDLLQQPVLPVFTTNYDPAIETYASETGIPLEFGFTMKTARCSWNPDTFHSYLPPANGPGLVLFKLHGSVTWYRDARGFKYVQEAQEGLRGNENMVIYPGDTKVGMLSEPYFTCYTYLRHCLRNATHAVVIGYSFRDPILQLLFREARLLNPELRFVVVNGRQPNGAGERLKEVVGEPLVLIPQPFEAGEDAPYLQELSAVFAPAPSASLEWIGKTEDLVGPGPGAYEPNGLLDGIFKLSIESRKKTSIERIDLYRVDWAGNELGERWTTAPGEPTWALGVFNESSERLGGLVVSDKKAVVVKLAASDNPQGETWFAPGERFRNRCPPSQGGACRDCGEYTLAPSRA